MRAINFNKTNKNNNNYMIKKLKNNHTLIIVIPMEDDNTLANEKFKWRRQSLSMVEC